MRRLLLLFTLTFVLSATVYAQEELAGRVLEAGTRVGLAGINIENTKTKVTTVTDNKGRFTIKAKVNDLIILKGFTYQADTVLLTDLKFKEIFLMPVQNMLKPVNVTGVEGPKTAGWTDPEYHGQAMTYQKDSRGFNKGGINLRIHYWTKDEKKRRKQADRDKEEKQREQIAAAFTPEVIGKYVPLKDEQLEDFILLYIPKTKVYFANDFNLLAYLESSYKDFQKLTPEQQKAGRLKVDW